MADPGLERRAISIAHSGLDLSAAFLALDDLLRSYVSYDVASWSTHDPATGLFTSCTMSGADRDPETEAHVFRCEFRDDEPSAYRFLIARGETAATLSDVTEGDLSRASRFREVLAPFGISDELRAVLWADGIAWASATLLRVGGLFGREDVDAVTSMGHQAADAVRLALLRSAASRPELVDEPPGLVEAQDDGRVVALTAPGQHWLDVAGDVLVTAANVVAAAARAGADWRGASTRLSLGDRGVLSLHAATLSTRDRVAVIVDRARPAEVSSMLVDAYGLTRRQREILGLLLLGRSMTQIAGSLGISEHTANDHRKAIYRRIGVSSRSELAGLLQAEQYDPRSWRYTTPSPYGGFLESAEAASQPR